MLRIAKKSGQRCCLKRVFFQETRILDRSRQQFPLSIVRGFTSSVPPRTESETSRIPVGAKRDDPLRNTRIVEGGCSSLFSTAIHNANNKASRESLSASRLLDTALHNTLFRANNNNVPTGRNESGGTPSLGLYQKRDLFSRHRSRLGAFNPHSSLSVAWLSTGPSLKTKEEVQIVSVPPVKDDTFTPRRNQLHPIPSRKLGKTRIPTPATGPDDPLDELSKTSTKSMIGNVLDMTWSVIRMIGLFTLRLPGNVVYFLTHPTASRDRVKEVWGSIKHEANHYWVGTKLLWEEIKTAKNLSFKTLDGTALTRRERKQLLRTVTDLFRLIPFSMFILIPFMEFALPFALRLFPNMLPSTYQDSLKAEETMKRELKSRIAMAEFFQETLEELAKKQKKKASKREKELKDAGVDVTQEGDFTAHHDSASSMLEFLEKARNGEMIPSDVMFRYANYFQDDLTLDNMPRMQLINMCRYMGIQPYGSDSFLRFQLRHKIRTIKEDDGRILWEGIESLNKMELREACQERGMRSTGLSKEAYRRALKEWLDLSVNKDIPIALLIMSRTFFLKEDVFQAQADDSSTMSGLADAISGLDKEIVNEAILEVATTDEKRSDPEVRKIKLEVLSQQNELIRAEEAARDAAAKKLRDEEEALKKEQIIDVAIETAANGAEKMELGELSVDTPEVKDIPATEIIKSQQVASEKQPTPTPLSHEISHKEDIILEPEVVADSDMTADRKAEEKSEEEGTLSPDEMDAISQLWTDDPVSKERADLERIKAAIKDELDDDTSEVKDEPEASLSAQEAPIPVDDITPVVSAEVLPPPDLLHELGDKAAKETIENMDNKVASEADAATTITIDAHLPTEEAKDEEVDEAEDPIVARLKNRVKSMVDKIEVQLTETQIKIGDKLHFLDKDKDGIFSMDEMAEALQTVLRRKISYEEAVEIASQMDANEDGLIVVDELIRWIDEHKLVEFVKEGRDADMDRIMESHASQAKQDDTTAAKPQ